MGLDRDDFDAINGLLTIRTANSASCANCRCTQPWSRPCRTTCAAMIVLLSRHVGIAVVFGGQATALQDVLENSGTATPLQYLTTFGRMQAEDP